MQEISLHILDLIQNSISANARLIEIGMTVDTALNTMTIEIKDNGFGMSKEMLAKVESPFTTTRKTRRVGMGIPLFKDGCEATGGSFRITSKPGVGTELTGVYVFSHIDRPPLGDFTGTIHSVIVCNPELDFLVKISYDGKEFLIDTRELKKVLGEEVKLNTPEVSEWIKGYIEEGYREITGGVNL